MHSYSPLKEAIRPFVPIWMLGWRQQIRARRRAVGVDALMRASGGRVLSGPFAGMAYTGEAVGSQPGPKLLGTYESELAAVVDDCCTRTFANVVDVGAAEGYYAIGTLRRMPNANGVAFESEPAGQRLLESMAKLNGVSNRLAIHGQCALPDLSAALKPGTSNLVIMDVEGAEDELLDAQRCAGLGSAWILVETHEHLAPGVTGRLMRRFEATHEIKRIDSQPLSATTLPTIPGLSPATIRLLADEMRSHPMSWLWMTPASALGGTN
jgi:hypothetical protein